MPAVISRQFVHSLHGVGVGPLLAVERLGQDARRGGLADAAHAGEEEGVRDAAGADGVAQRARDVFLNKTTS